VENAKRLLPRERFCACQATRSSRPWALDRTLTPDEIITYTEHLKPLVESGTGQERRAAAYLAAAKE